MATKWPTRQTIKCGMTNACMRHQPEKEQTTVHAKFQSNRDEGYVVTSPSVIGGILVIEEKIFWH